MSYIITLSYSCFLLLVLLRCWLLACLFVPPLRGFLLCLGRSLGCHCFSSIITALSILPAYFFFLPQLFSTTNQYNNLSLYYSAVCWASSCGSTARKKNPCFCQFHSLFLVAAGWLSLTGGGGGGPFRRLACFCCRSVASRLTRIHAMRCLPNIDDLLPTWTSSSRTPSRTSCGTCFLNLKLKLETSSRIH